MKYIAILLFCSLFPSFIEAYLSDVEMPDLTGDEEPPPFVFTDKHIILDNINELFVLSRRGEQRATINTDSDEWIANFCAVSVEDGDDTIIASLLNNVRDDSGNIIGIGKKVLMYRSDGAVKGFVEDPLAAQPQQAYFRKLFSLEDGRIIAWRARETQTIIELYQVSLHQTGQINADYNVPVFEVEYTKDPLYRQPFQPDSLLAQNKNIFLSAYANQLYLTFEVPFQLVIIDLQYKQKNRRLPGARDLAFDRTAYLRTGAKVSELQRTIRDLHVDQKGIFITYKETSGLSTNGKGATKTQRISLTSSKREFASITHNSGIFVGRYENNLFFLRSEQGKSLLSSRPLLR